MIEAWDEFNQFADRLIRETEQRGYNYISEHPLFFMYDILLDYARWAQTYYHQMYELQNQ
jgi:hypothetical protein